MTRLHALFVVLAFWAAIYLPGLGSTELKGEEGRRILPAVAMLESGNWLVPYVGGEPYLRKPPLVNWAIASSMKLCGVRNEWSARLPSVLFVLALGLTVAGVCTPWLGARSAAAAALFAIANISLIEKGRLAEIEGIYVSLSGIAIVLWMAWALQERSRWLLWTVPFVFLGLAALAKGPMHLLFFYAVVLATPRGRREFLSLPHLVGLVLMGAIFASWSVPYFHATAQLSATGAKADAAGVWEEQMRERFGGGSFSLRDWLLSIPRGLSNFLPWLLLVPFWWRKPEASAAEESAPAPWFRHLRNVTVVLYIGMLLIPGVLPRYMMPLLIPAGVLLAVALRRPVQIGKRPVDGFRFALSGAALAALGMIVFAIFIVPRANLADDIRPVGRAISDALPAGEPLYVYDPGYQPALFYVRPPLVYQNDLEQLPAQVPWLLCRDKAVDKFRKHWTGIQVLQEFKDKQGNKLKLVALSGRRGAATSPPAP